MASLRFWGRARRRLVGLLVALAAVLAARVAAAQPSEAPVVVVYTIGQGDDPFEKFGHTTICLRIPRRPRDGGCFDYGAADFTHVERTVWRFLRGEGSFFLEREPEQKMFASYRQADRTIWRQVLPLADAEAGAVRAHLERDATDRQWRYAYRLLDDNCATRVRDLLDAALAGRLRAATAGQPGEGRTYRSFGRTGFADEVAVQLVLDLFLGRYADRVPDRWQQMFLPEKLRDELAGLLAIEPELVYQRKGWTFSTDFGSGGRLFLPAFALLLALPVLGARCLGRLVRTATAWASIWLGLLGLLVWTVALLNPFPEGLGNEVAVVLLPLDLVLPFVGRVAQRRYARARVGLLALAALMAAAGLLRQPLWVTLLVPLLPMLVIGFVPARRGAAAKAT